MITEFDKLEAEIFCCVRQIYDMYPCPLSPPLEQVLEYLEKCFAAKRILDEQNKLN